MTNSPTLCQVYVAAALMPLRDKCPRLYTIHYMDDILLSGPNKSEGRETFEDLREDLQSVRLVLTPEKIQQNFSLSIFGTSIISKGNKTVKITN